MGSHARAMAMAARPAGNPARVWWLPLLLVLLMGWWTLRMGSAASPWCFLDFANLAFHEAGHLFLRPFGSTIHYLGGTIFQILVPAGLAAYALVKHRRPLAAAFCAWWLGESLVNVGRYMADARSLDLPLVGGGDHDWNELFYRFGLLGESAVASVSSWTHRLGVVVMLAGLAWAAVFALPDAAHERVKEAIGSRFPGLRGLFE